MNFDNSTLSLAQRLTETGLTDWCFAARQHRIGQFDHSAKWEKRLLKK